METDRNHERITGNDKNISQVKTKLQRTQGTETTDSPVRDRGHK